MLSTAPFALCRLEMIRPRFEEMGHCRFSLEASGRVPYLAQAFARACQATVRLCITAWCETVNEGREKGETKNQQREKQREGKKKKKWIEND